MFAVTLYLLFFFSAFKLMMLTLPIHRDLFTISVEDSSSKHVLQPFGYHTTENYANLKTNMSSPYFSFRGDDSVPASIIQSAIFYDLRKVNLERISTLPDYISKPMLVDEDHVEQYYFFAPNIPIITTPKKAQKSNFMILPRTYSENDTLTESNIEVESVIETLTLPISLLMPLILFGSYFALLIAKERFTKTLEIALISEGSLYFILRRFSPILIITLLTEFFILYNQELTIQGTLLALASFFPIIAIHFIVPFIIVIISKNEAEINNLVTISTIFMVVALVFPTFFINYEPIARLSPLSPILQMIQGDSVPFSYIAQSNVLLSSIVFILIIWSIILFQGERVVCNTNLLSTVLSAISRYKALYGSIVFIVFSIIAGISGVVIGFGIEVVISTLSTFVPRFLYLILIIPAFVLVEEFLKAYPLYILIKHDDKDLNVYVNAFIIGIFFFLTEKVITALYFESMFGNLDLFLEIVKITFKEKVFLFTLLIHPITTMIFGFFNKYYHWRIALIPAFFVHLFYNLILIRVML